MKKRFALVGTMAIFVGATAAIQVDGRRDRDIRTRNDVKTETVERGTPGACCLYNGSCITLLEDDCYARPDSYQFHPEMNCSEVQCKAASLGACCFDDETCQMLDDYQCYIAGGNSQWVSCEEVICLPACDELEIFDSTAMQLTVESCQTLGYTQLGDDITYGLDNGSRFDLDGDGSDEYIRDFAFYRAHPNPMWEEKIYATAIVRGSQIGSLKSVAILDVSPDNITYQGVDLPPSSYDNDITIRHISYFDVTGDGLVDALVEIEIWENDSQAKHYFYIENMSMPPAVACAGDLDNDGEVRVSDLLALMANWGTCSQ